MTKTMERKARERASQSRISPEEVSSAINRIEAGNPLTEDDRKYIAGLLKVLLPKRAGAPKKYDSWIRNVEIVINIDFIAEFRGCSRRQACELHAKTENAQTASIQRCYSAGIKYIEKNAGKDKRLDLKIAERKALLDHVRRTRAATEKNPT